MLRTSTFPVLRCCLPSLVIAAGCAAGDAGTVPAAVVRDSAGISIVENGAAAAERPLPWTLSSSPELTIGVAEGPDEYQLFRVNGVAQLPDGRTVVVNGGTQEIRFYDAAGRYLHAVGGRGGGPGEYQFPRLVPAVSHDDLLIGDLQAARYTLLRADGEVERTLPLTDFIGTALGRLGGTRMLVTRSGASAGADTPEGMMPNDRTLSIVDLDGGEAHELGVFPGRVLLSRQGGMIAFTPVPYEAVATAATSADGIHVTPGAHPEVRWYDGDGVLRRVARIDQAPRPLPRAEFDRFVEERVDAASEELRPDVRRRYARMPVPELLPAYRDLKVDALGHVWARIHDTLPPDSAMRWTVFDPDGVALGVMRTPPRLIIQQIGEDFVLGTLRDDLDVERVVRFRLDR